jgi:hypothetical protein
VHSFIVVLVLENAGESHLHDCCVHENDVEDSFHGGSIVSLSLFASVDDDPPHTPSWCQISFSEP